MATWLALRQARPRLAWPARADSLANRREAPRCPPRPRLLLWPPPHLHPHDRALKTSPFHVVVQHADRLLHEPFGQALHARRGERHLLSETAEVQRLWSMSVSLAPMPAAALAAFPRSAPCVSSDSPRAEPARPLAELLPQPVRSASLSAASVVPALALSVARDPSLSPRLLSASSLLARQWPPSARA